MSTLNYTNNYYANLILNNDISNKYCVDCGRENPSHVSINNGVTLCEDCSDVHLSLGISVSYIRSLYGKWDNYLYKYFLFGGNQNFLNMLKMFSIDPSLYDINTKYTTKAISFYRKALKAKVDNKDVIMFNTPDYLDNTKDSYEYQIENIFCDYQVNNKGKFEKVVGMVAKKLGGVGKKLEKLKNKAKFTKNNITSSFKGLFNNLTKKKENFKTNHKNNRNTENERYMHDYTKEAFNHENYNDLVNQNNKMEIDEI